MSIYAVDVATSWLVMYNILEKNAVIKVFF